MKYLIYILTGILFFGCLPKDNSALYNKACDLENRNEFNEAIKILTKAIEIVPNDIECLNNRAWDYYELGDFKNAYKDFEEILKYSKQNTAGLYGIAFLKYKEKKYQKAIELFDQIIKLKRLETVHIEWKTSEFETRGPLEANMEKVYHFRSLAIKEQQTSSKKSNRCASP